MSLNDCKQLSEEGIRIVKVEEWPPRADRLEKTVMDVVASLRFMNAMFPILESTEETDPKFFKLLKTVFKNLNYLRAAVYFAKYEAATLLTLSRALEVSVPTTYRIIKDFSSIGFVVPLTEFKDTTGRPVTVWAIPKANPKATQRAIMEHKSLSNPRHRKCIEIAQKVITDYMEPNGIREIRFKELKIIIARFFGSSTDIHMVEEIAWILQKKGVKVWR